MKNLIHAFRSLTRHPKYTVLAVLTLAAGIGVTAAMFGLLDILYFRPLPITEPERLVELRLESPANRFGSFSYEEFRDIEGAAPGFKDVIAIGQRGVTLNQDGEAHMLLIHYVSGNYFPSLGIPMHLGRGFTPSDDTPDVTTPQVVINHYLWTARFGARADIVGRTIQLNSTHFTVIGVTAPGFVGLRRPVTTDLWVTVQQAPFVVRGLRDELTTRNQRWFRLIGRLANGTDIATARAGLDVLLARWRASDAKEYSDAKIVASSREGAARKEALQGAIMLGIVGLVLLIACANVANLTLARGEARRREMAVRAALGAGRGSLMWQMLVESTVVVVAAAGLGLLVAAWLVQLFPALLPPGTSMVILDVRIDGRLLLFASLLAVLATALVGLVPAWRASKADIIGALKGQTSDLASDRRRFQLRDALVVGEIALSGVVIIAAGLLVRSFAQGLAVDPGFDTRKNVATFYVVPGLKGYDNAATYRYLETARQHAATVAGVARASYAIRLPAQGNEAGWAAAFTIPGHQPPPGKDAFDLRYTMVGPGYFEVMGTRIVVGRGIEDQDLPGSAPVAVISESMARRFWPGESPIGRRIRMGRSKPVDREIVGVAEDIRIGSLYEAAEAYVYVPYAQQQQAFALVLVEMQGDPNALVAPVKAQIAAVDTAIPILRVGSIREHMNLLLYEDRRNAWIGFTTALLALTLGTIGVYGVVSLSTARRTREMGIRIALGAERRQLVRLLLGQGMVLAGAGAALGVIGGVETGRLLQSQLHGISPADAVSVTVGTGVLLLVALAASFVPAWRVSRVDPVVALRDY